MLWVNAIANVLESILAFAGVLAGAGALYIIWLAVQGIMMISFLFLLPFFALSVAFEWAEKIANWLFAVFFVGAVLFGFIVVSCLEIGEWAADTLPVGGTLWIIAMLCASIIFVIMAVIACHKVIEHYHGKIHGRVRSWGKSDVKGKVKTEPTDKQGMQERHAAAFRRSVPARRAAVAVSTATGAGAVATVGAAGAAGVAGAAGNMGVPGRSGATGSAGGPGRAARTSAGASPQGRAPGSPSQILKRETTTRPTVKNIRNIQTGSDRSGSPPSRQGGRATRPPDTRRPPGRSSGPPPR